MKNNVTARITEVDFFVFHQLLLDDVTIHLSFTEQKHRQAAERLLRGMSRQITYLPARRMTAAELAAMLSRQRPFAEFSPSVFIREGTPFQQRVWELLCRIPAGATRTYGDLAQAMGSRALARAVGQACGANPIALLIPCHRVVGHAGPGGFAGGIDLKKKLLKLEARGQGSAAQTMSSTAWPI